MSYSFDDLRERGNAAVAFALTEARKKFQKGRFDDYDLGYAAGQILVAYGDLCADDYVATGARNEIHFLRRRTRKGGAA